MLYWGYARYSYSLVSLVDLVADGCCAVFQLILSAKNLAPEYRYLTIRLELEQQRFYSWGAEIGLQRFIDGDRKADHLESLGLNQTIVIHTVFQVQVLATDFIKYQTKFGALVPDDFDRTGNELIEGNINVNGLDKFPDIMDFLKKKGTSHNLLKACQRDSNGQRFIGENTRSSSTDYVDLMTF